MSELQSPNSFNGYTGSDMGFIEAQFGPEIPGGPKYQRPPDDMTLRELMQQVADDGHRWFPKVDDNIVYTTLGLCGEVGEATDVVKKYERYTLDWEGLTHRLPEEIIDILVYALKLAHQIGMDPQAEYDKKRKVNEERFGHNTHDIRTLGRNSDA